MVYTYEKFIEECTAYVRAYYRSASENSEEIELASVSLEIISDNDFRK